MKVKVLRTAGTTKSEELGFSDPPQEGEDCTVTKQQYEGLLKLGLIEEIELPNQSTKLRGVPPESNLKAVEDEPKK